MEQDMGIEAVDLGGLAFSSYLYCQSTGYDRAYGNLLRQVSGNIRLSDPSHGEAVLSWLNDWGCRQFSVDQHFSTVKRLQKWDTEFEGYLPPRNEPLGSLNIESLGMVADAYEALRSLTASVRKDGVKMTVGPTGASKIMFALRPRQLPPWDDPVRKANGWKGDRASYFEYLCAVQTTTKRLHSHLAAFGLDEKQFAALIGRPEITLSKLIDEYMWLTVTRRFKLPSRTDLEQWSVWKTKSPMP
jgi:hypothetical protein